MTPPSTEGQRVAPVLDATEWRLRYEAAKTYEHMPWCGQNKWQHHDDDCYCIKPRATP